MDTVRWRQPVMIICRRSGQLYTVTSTGEALDALLKVWPVAEGRAFLAALQVCNSVKLGVATPEDARTAFIAAAQEANIPIDSIAPAHG